MCFFPRKRKDSVDQNELCAEVSSRLLTLTEGWKEEGESAQKARLSAARERIKRIVFPRADEGKIAELYNKVIAACDDLVALGVTGKPVSVLDERERGVEACVNEIEQAITEWEKVR